MIWWYKVRIIRWMHQNFQNNQVFSIFDGSPKMLSWWKTTSFLLINSGCFLSILIGFLSIIFPVFDSRGLNQLFDRAAAACSEWFLFNPILHSITFLSINCGFATVCRALYFDHDLFRTLLSYVIHFSSPVMSRFKNGSISFRFSNDS